MYGLTNNATANPTERSNTVSKPSNARVKCEICGTKAHVLEAHILKAHDMTLAEYLDKFPGASLLSETAKAFLARQEAELLNMKTAQPVKTLFGFTPFDGVDTIQAFENPKSSTPVVDPAYCFRRSELKMVLYAIGTRKRVLLSGPTGSGKTSVIQQTAARLNWGYTRFGCDSDLSRSDLVGLWTLRGEETVFQYGPLVRAMREGHILVIDEWDVANPSVAMLLQPVLEGEPFYLAETGELISPHEDFRIFATANTIGLGDESGLYSGTQPQNYASLDRFSIVWMVDYASKVDERKVLKARTKLPDGDIEKMLDVAGLVRKAFVAQEIMTTMSTRTLVNLCDLTVDFGNAALAFEAGYLNKMNKEDRGVVKELIQRIFG